MLKGRSGTLLVILALLVGLGATAIDNSFMASHGAPIGEPVWLKYFFVAGFLALSARTIITKEFYSGVFLALAALMILFLA